MSNLRSDVTVTQSEDYVKRSFSNVQNRFGYGQDEWPDGAIWVVARERRVLRPCESFFLKIKHFLLLNIRRSDKSD